MQIYGVSSGNGNDGVSHMFPDYYVKTADPWRLAEVAMLDKFKPEFMPWAKSEMDIDGEAEFTICACLYNPMDDEDGSYCDYNGAWYILEVFPVVEDEMRDGTPSYDSLEEAHTKEALSLA